MKKIVIAGILGGIVMFMWGAICHVVLPVGSMGLKNLPNEDAVLNALKQSVNESGLFFYPGLDMTRKLSEAEQRAWEARYEAGPTGLLLYNVQGSKPMPPSRLLMEVVSDILAALILAVLFSRMPGTVASRAIVGGCVGLFAWLTISTSYWNWYGFPAAFILGEGLDQIIGWLLAGAVMGWVLKPKQPTGQTATLEAAAPAA